MLSQGSQQGVEGLIVSYFGMTRGTFAISGFSEGVEGLIVSYFGMTRGTFAISGFSTGGRGAYCELFWDDQRVLW